MDCKWWRTGSNSQDMDWIADLQSVVHNLKHNYHTICRPSHSVDWSVWTLSCLPIALMDANLLVQQRSCPRCFVWTPDHDGNIKVRLSSPHENPASGRPLQALRGHSQVVHIYFVVSVSWMLSCVTLTGNLLVFDINNIYHSLHKVPLHLFNPRTWIKSVTSPINKSSNQRPF